MEIEFFNRGLLNIIEPHGIKPEDVARVQFGECTILITLKNGERYTVQYMIELETWSHLLTTPDPRQTRMNI